MTDQAPKLLPCPFCGSPANLRRFAVSKDEFTKIPNMVSHIQCVNDEGCKVTVDIQHMNEAVAIEAWNTRPPSERWPEPTSDQIAAVDRIVAPEFASGNWVDVEKEESFPPSERPVAQVREALEAIERGEYTDLPPLGDSRRRALTAERPEAAVAWRDALADIQSHHEAWRQALASRGDHALRCNDPDDAAYWRHEIKVLERVRRSLAIPHEEPGRERPSIGKDAP